MSQFSVWKEGKHVRRLLKINQSQSQDLISNTNQEIGRRLKI